LITHRIPTKQYSLVPSLISSIASCLNWPSTILILPFPPDFLPVGRRFGLDEIVDLGVAQFVDQLAGVSFVVVQIWQIVLAVDQLLFVMFYHGAFSHVALCQGTGKEKN
jgi:hypothetical protein